HTRAALDAVFRARRTPPNVVMETESPEAMKRLAEVGVGIAILPEAQVQQEIASGRLRVLAPADAHFSRTLAWATRRGRALRRAIPGRGCPSGGPPPGTSQRPRQRSRATRRREPAGPGRPRRNPGTGAGTAGCERRQEFDSSSAGPHPSRLAPDAADRKRDRD